MHWNEEYVFSPFEGFVAHPAGRISPLWDEILSRKNQLDGKAKVTRLDPAHRNKTVTLRIL